MEKKRSHRWHDLISNPLVSAIVSAIITATITATIASLIQNQIMSHDYIPFNSVSVLFEKYFVEAGYVDRTILDYDTADKQFEMLSAVLEDYASSVDSSLINLGLSADKVSGMSRLDKLSKLPSLALDSSNEIQKYISSNQSLYSENSDLKRENEELEKNIDDYKKQPQIEIHKSNLIIDGESMNAGDSIRNAVVIAEGNVYYSQTILNSYILSETIKYNASEDAIIYGNQKPEKEKLSWNSMVSDVDRDVQVYTMGKSGTFSMGKNTYGEGVVLSDGDSFYIHLKNEYSLMSFTYGHVDDTSQGNLELTILAMDESGESYTTTLKKIKLSGEMEPKTVEVPLGYASAVKLVVSSGDYKARYGLANIYLYS